MPSSEEEPHGRSCKACSRIGASGAVELDDNSRVFWASPDLKGKSRTYSQIPSTYLGFCQGRGGYFQGPNVGNLYPKSKNSSDLAHYFFREGPKYKKRKFRMLRGSPAP